MITQQLIPVPNQSITVSQLIAKLGGEVRGSLTLQISQVAALDTAEAGEISFLSNPKYRRQLATTQASVVILRSDAFSDDLPQSDARAYILTNHPYAYYARVAALLNPAQKPSAGVHISAQIANNVASTLPNTVHLGAGVVIGSGVSIGENTVLHANVCVMADVSIGKDCIIYPNVVLYPGTQIGDRCILHSGVVLGADGFGFAPDAGQWVKIPQIGRVILGNDVEIGANTTVDRGAINDTCIGDGTKLDNQIQVGHNCIIGRNCVVAASTAIAGSTKIEDNVVIGGATAIAGHITISSGVTVSGASTVMKSLTKPGQYTSVYPLEEHSRWLQNASQLRHLNRLAERIAQLEAQLKTITTEG